jgi:putative membrane protein
VSAADAPATLPDEPNPPRSAGPSSAGGEGMRALSTNELAQARTSMALKRTMMAADRTLMAWVRTSMSTTGFGFTLYKVMQGFQQSGVLTTGTTPREAGLLLIGLGTAAIVIGISDHVFTVRDLRRIGPIRLRRPSLSMAVLMAAFNVALFATLLARVL